MVLYNNDGKHFIAIPKNCPKSILLATQDLVRDLNKLCNKDTFSISNEKKPSIEILLPLGKSKEKESYEVKINDNKITVSASDELGTVYGIYAILTKGLNISPMYRFNDLFPTTTDYIEIPNGIIKSQKRNTTFRGWFVNDEDLLCEFKSGGGKRDINYPFYNSIIAPDILDMILESALRLEYNLIIPSTLVNICNADEEKLISASVERGLFVSQHHIEPLGVSWFTAEKYLEKINAKDEEFSFIKNERRVVELWTIYAKRWAKYKDKVVWQLGLRGKADRAVWENDKSVPKDAKSRGKLIEKAIFTQWQIIADALQSTDFYSTITLWMEGAELYGKGYIKLPKNCIVVFSDLGFTQTFGEDFYLTKRKKNQKYGVYYHSGYWGLGPHLAEGVDPHKMIYSYKLAQQNGGVFYSMLNVANIREMQNSISLNSALLLNSPITFDYKSYQKEHYSLLFGKLYKYFIKGEKMYYNAIADNGNKEGREYAEKYNFFYHDYFNKEFPAYPASDGFLRFFGGFVYTDTTLSKEQYNRYLVSTKRFNKLDKYYTKLKKKIPQNAIHYFEFYNLLQTRYMMLMNKWVVLCADARILINKNADKSLIKQAYQKTLDTLNQVLSEREVGEKGKWKGWYKGDRKLFYENIRNETIEKVKSFDK